MDYSLIPYLEEEDNIKINNITLNLDKIMGELYTGKSLKFIDIISDMGLMEKIKNEYNSLINKEEDMIKEDIDLLRNTASKSFILSWTSIISAYFIPFMIIPSIYTFARGMKCYTSYKTLSNKDVINEYLSTFDDLLNRINDYNNLLLKKLGNYTSKGEEYMQLLNLYMGKELILNEELSNKIIKVLQNELNDNEEELSILVNKTLEYMSQKNEEEIINDNKTLCLKK